MSQLVVIPQGRNSESFLELARTPEVKGRLFRKHILSEGVLHYKSQKINIDSKFLNSVVTNFNAKACDIVQVPIVGDNNNHSEDPTRNIGEVVGLSVENGKLYSLIDARKSADDLGSTLIGASAMLSTNYTNNDTGEKVGPTLLHVAITNRPHVLNLDDFEEVIKASSEDSSEAILLSEDSEDETTEIIDTKENQDMTLEELTATLKADHGIDIAELSATNESLTSEVAELKASVITQEENAVSLSAAIGEHLVNSGIIKLSSSDGESTNEGLIEAVTEAGLKLSTLSEETVTLSSRVDELFNAAKNTAAETLVGDLIKAGKILPKDKDAMIELNLSNSELFDKLVPETAIIDLSAQLGDDENREQTIDLAASEVARLIESTK